MNKIAFIGAGNMCRAMVSGLVKHDYPAQLITVANPSEPKRTAMAEQFGVHHCQDNIEAAKDADYIFLCVKPHFIAEVCQQLAQAFDVSNKCFISVAAGTTMAQIEQALAKPCSVIRTMPNTPSQLGLGVTGAFANQHTSQLQQSTTTQLLQAMGIVTWLDAEAEIDHIISVSGSGPAYFFLFMEAMEQKAITLGFSAEQARALVQQTALGAAQMVVQNQDTSISQLRANVTSKGGTTNAAIQHFIGQGLTEMVSGAMDAAINRAKEMANEA